MCLLFTLPLEEQTEDTSVKVSAHANALAAGSSWCFVPRYYDSAFRKNVRYVCKAGLWHELTDFIGIRLR